MPTTSASDRIVVLRGGLALPEEAIRFALELEARGVTLTATPDGDLLARPSRLLNDADRQTIRRLKTDLLAIVRYCDTEGWRA
jgi:hypothetical protein